MIPVCEPLLDGNEREYVLDCLDTNWISSQGDYLRRFEDGFARYCGCKYGVAVTSGTAALHVALLALGIGPGDEVIVPTFTMAACAFAVLYTGARPVFVDCSPDTYNIDPARIEEKITPRTKAIMPVHLYGHPCNLEFVRHLASQHGLTVVEDAAEAHGAEYRTGDRWAKAGSMSDMGCFSFFANKLITTGEGGMIVTNDSGLAEKARSLRDLAHSKTRFLHERVGYNYRMTNIQAAIGLAQLETLDRHIEARRHHASVYNALLGDLSLQLPVERPDCKNVYWMYGVLLKDRETRDGLMRHLTGKEIGSRAFFVPMHQQPMFEDTEGSFPVAGDVSARGLYLPSSTGLTDKQVKTVADEVRKFLGARS